MTKPPALAPATPQSGPTVVAVGATWGAAGMGSQIHRPCAGAAAVRRQAWGFIGARKAAQAVHNNVKGATS